MAELHRIRRLSWRVSARSRDEAFGLRRELRDALGTTLVDAVGAAFDRAAPGPDVVRIPRLDLRLRVQTIDEIDSVLTAELARVVREHAAPGRAGGSAPAAAGENDLWMLRQYLEMGSLPWFAAGRDRDATMAALVEGAVEWWPLLADALPPSSDRAAVWTYFFRLLGLLPDAEWPSVARHVDTSDGVAGALDWPRFVALMTRAPAPGTYRRQSLAAAAVSAARAGTRVTDLSGLRAAMLRFANSTPVSAMVELAAADIDRWAAAIWPAASTTVPAGPASPTATVALHPAAAAAHLPNRAQLPAVSESAGLSVAVDNAGLVLLAPFVPRFFESTGIAAPGATVLPPGGLPRAAALLSLVATGRTAVQEFELGFIKVLLGLRPESPLPIAEGLIQAADHDEAGALLEAVVGHWSALKRTSVEGLRSSFLQRPGLLRDDERAWQLRIEPRPYDVLLEQLPWGISTTTLPWLTIPILTDWPSR